MINSSLKKVSFYNLSWPILLDNALRIIVVCISSWLINQIHIKAVAIMVIVNSFILFSFSIIEFFSQSCLTTITQYKGANFEIQALASALAIIILNFFLGTAISVLFVVFPSYLLKLISSDSFLIDFGSQYLKIIGYGYGAYGVSYAVITILNAYGKTLISMMYSLAINLSILIITAIVVLEKDNQNNYFLLNEIAKIHLIIRIIGAVFLLFIFLKFKEISSIKDSYRHVKKEVKILTKLGILNLIEPISYHIMQLFFIRFVDSIGMYGLIVRGYMTNISIVLELIPLALSKANQIIIGFYIGALKYKNVCLQLKKSILLCLSLCCLIIIPVFLSRNAIISLFTNDSLITEITKNLINISFIIMLFKCINFNLSTALKAGADYKFLTILYILVPWFFTVPTSYLAINYINKNIYFLWLILVSEEIIKIFFLFKRWSKGYWKTNLIINRI